MLWLRGACATKLEERCALAHLQRLATPRSVGVNAMEWGSADSRIAIIVLARTDVVHALRLARAVTTHFSDQE